jgi:hypothetical protein
MVAQGFNEVIKSIPSDRAANDAFCYSVLISGDYATVGACGENEDSAGGNSAFGVRSAYIFERDWTGN